MRARDMLVKLKRAAGGIPQQRTRPHFEVLPRRDYDRARLLYAKQGDALEANREFIEDAMAFSDDEWLERLRRFMPEAETKQLAELLVRCGDIEWPDGDDTNWLGLPLEFDDYWARQRDRDEDLPGIARNGDRYYFTGCTYGGGLRDLGIRYKFRRIPWADQERLRQAFWRYGWDGNTQAIDRTERPIMKEWREWKARDQALLFRCLEAANVVEPELFGRYKRPEAGASAKPNGGQRGLARARENGRGNGQGLDPAKRAHDRDGEPPGRRGTTH